jgi:[ribosomal protein S18]-alanine N-acetyltransferase
VELKIRDYRPEDFTTLWQIDQRCFLPGIAYSRYELRTYIGRSGAFTLVAEVPDSPRSPEEKILGFLVGESSWRSAGHIITIDVRQEFRRYRVGSHLLNAAEVRFRERRCRLARLETAVDNQGALAFYKRHGYDVIRAIPGYYANGVDALVLEKDLLLPVCQAKFPK